MMKIFAVIAILATAAFADQCSISDFTAVGPYTSSPEQCGSSGCTYYLESRYYDCERFCNDNGLQCTSARVVGEGQSFVGCDGAQGAGTTEIPCANEGTSKARYSRVCTCEAKQQCDIIDTSVVGPYTSSPEECSAADASGCKWYLETRYADCTEFCADNGLECVGSEVLGTGTTFTGCAGADTDGVATPIDCSSTGTEKARYSRTCTCAVPKTCEA